MTEMHHTTVVLVFTCLFQGDYQQFISHAKQHYHHFKIDLTKYNILRAQKFKGSTVSKTFKFYHICLVVKNKLKLKETNNRNLKIKNTREAIQTNMLIIKSRMIIAFYSAFQGTEGQFAHKDTGY